MKALNFVTAINLAMAGVIGAFILAAATQAVAAQPSSQAVAGGDRVATENQADDAMITGKVKALFIKDDRVKALDINVDTSKGIVKLSGWVDSPDQIEQAEKLARSVEGVKDVRNNLQVKS